MGGGGMHSSLVVLKCVWEGVDVGESAYGNDDV